MSDNVSEQNESIGNNSNGPPCVAVGASVAMRDGTEHHREDVIVTDYSDAVEIAVTVGGMDELLINIDHGDVADVIDILTDRLDE